MDWINHLLSRLTLINGIPATVPGTGGEVYGAITYVSILLGVW